MAAAWGEGVGLVGVQGDLLIEKNGAKAYIWKCQKFLSNFKAAYNFAGFHSNRNSITLSLYF